MLTIDRAAREAQTIALDGPGGAGPPSGPARVRSSRCCSLLFMRTSDEESRLPTLSLTPIGIIHSTHHDANRTPIQPACAPGSAGRIEVFEAYAEGLADIEGFSHLHILYWLDRAAPASLTVMPFLEDVFHGIFATRAPMRPNPLGLSVVRLLERRGRVLLVEDLDVLDGTPLLDIKPYVERFDVRQGTRGGWTDGVDAETFRRRGRRDGPEN
jgi:tRNA-Thr(GGU) m(6)t(6)A37 methyltransferase TsaA